MYEFYLGDNKHSIKNSWEELTSYEFIFLAGLLKQFRKAEMNLFELKIRLVLHLLGFKGNRLKIKTGNGQFSENIYHLSREVCFFYRIEYDDKKAFDSFSSNIRKELVHKFPDDLPESPETRAAKKLKKHVVLHAEFGKNLVPAIKTGRQHYKGYTFDVVDNLAKTSLSAMQFCEAQKLISQYQEKESVESLNLLCGILYQKGNYNERLAGELAGIFKRVESQVKEAVLLNFLAITNFIVHQTKYAILFEKPKTGKKQKRQNMYSLGFAGNMYQLSKKGYGDSGKMENTNLFTFFDLLLKELSDSVSELEKAGKKKGEIAEIMNLTIPQVNDLIS